MKGRKENEKPLKEKMKRGYPKWETTKNKYLKN